MPALTDLAPEPSTSASVAPPSWGPPVARGSVSALLAEPVGGSALQPSYRWLYHLPGGQRLTFFPAEQVGEEEAALRAAISDYQRRWLSDRRRQRWLKRFLERFPYACPHCGARLFGEWQGCVWPGVEEL